MTLPAITLPTLRLRPITELPECNGPMPALIVLVDDTPGADNIGAHLSTCLFVWLDGTWVGELYAEPLPDNARWWLPEHELTDEATAHTQRAATINGIWGDAR